MNLLKAFVWIRIAVGLVLAALGAAQLVIFIVWLWRCEPHNLDGLRGLPGTYQVRYHFGQISCNDPSMQPPARRKSLAERHLQHPPRIADARPACSPAKGFNVWLFAFATPCAGKWLLRVTGRPQNMSAVTTAFFESGH
jgi:hypothetical protein